MSARQIAVLILIVVEDGLVQLKHSVDKCFDCIVLILIVVEDGLVLAQSQSLYRLILSSLNPYCSGRWSRTLDAGHCPKLRQRVLILIVVEDGLVLDLIRHY